MEETPLKFTSLYQEHLKIKAQIHPFAGFNMPIVYNSIKEEVHAVRHSVGIFDVSHMGEFFVEGPDSQEFINFLLTNDLSKIPIQKAIYSPICNENGTIIDDLIVYKLNNEKFLICVNASNIQ